MSNRRALTILGSTGSIGVNTLDVIERHSDKFRVAALTAHTRVELLLQQCLRFAPDYAVVADDAQARALTGQLRRQGSATQVLAGAPALETVAALPGVDSVMAAIVGGAGLRPALAAANAGKRVLLANKEALVMAGALFMDAVRASGALLLPIDSEHNAVFQCLPRDFARGLDAVGVRRIVLTASGGPFRTLPLDALASVTPEQACRHPNWVMGRKISVDSATMMNKGLEVIEACWLFGARADQVQVVVHPQSVIHSLVTYLDGSTLAQMSFPDMRTPIAYALGYPERLDAGVRELDLVEVGALHFEPVDAERFPCVQLALTAFSAGGTAPAILNAANEVAVEAFLAGRIRFTQIAALIRHALVHPSAQPAALQHPAQPAASLADVLQADEQARQRAHAWLREHAQSEAGAGVSHAAGAGATTIN
jgi:1-deoxy-D-xylulose-5-phosphate reductoisomerase